MTEPGAWVRFTHAVVLAEPRSLEIFNHFIHNHALKPTFKIASKWRNIITGRIWSTTQVKQHEDRVVATEVDEEPDTQARTSQQYHVTRTTSVDDRSFNADRPFNADVCVKLDALKLTKDKPTPEETKTGCFGTICRKKRVLKRTQGSSNTAIRAEPQTIAMDAKARPPDSRTPSRRSMATGYFGGPVERLSNVHVIEDIYYGIAGKTDLRTTWKPYDPAHFRAVRMVIGKGASSQAHLLQHIQSGYLGVMKVIPPNKIFSAKTELSILAECENSPFILQVVDAFSFEKTSYIFLEYAPFRTLDDLTQLEDGIGSDKSALFALEILLGIQHLHSLSILHRDIKPENVFILISGHVKLGDFSCSTRLDPKTNKARGLCCTYATRPPEVWDYEFYSYPVDVWAFGISVYNIISNTWPILHASQERQVMHVKRGDIFFSSSFSPAAADLISRAVQPNPEDRWTVAQLVSHSYFKPLRDPFPAPFSPNHLLDMYSSLNSLGEELSYVQDMVAHLP